jgi:phosphocarrier protein HPr
MKMQCRQVRVTNPWGIHARAAARIVLLASRFRCSVLLGFQGRTANARSIMAVMLLAAGAGSAVWIETSGADETEALEAVSTLIASKHVV